MIVSNQHHKSKLKTQNFSNSINHNVIANYLISNGAEEITNYIDSSALVKFDVLTSVKTTPQTWSKEDIFNTKYYPI